MRPPTTAEVTWLAHLSQAVWLAPSPTDRRDAIVVVVHHAQRLHHNGIPWHRICAALAVSSGTLRRWRRTTPPQLPSTGEAAKPTYLPPLPTQPWSVVLDHIEPASAVPITTWEQPRERPLTTSIPTSATYTSPALTLGPPSEGGWRVLIATGDAQPGNNRFDHELSAIRQALEFSTVHVVERSCAAPDELVRFLTAEKPAILHLAAHTAHGALAFRLDGGTYWVDQEDIGQALRHGPPPQIAVLNSCTTFRLANTIAEWCPAVVYWPSTFDDDQARVFGDTFYRTLARGLPVAAAVTTGYHLPPDSRPRMIGNPDLAPFRANHN